MCELMGLNAVEDMDVTDLLREFFSHSPRHPNGWGMAIPRGGQMSIEKEPIQALRSQYLKERLMGGVRTKLMLAHIRYATIGGEAYNNSHPFTAQDNYGRVWTLIHNGTIFDYQPLSPFQYQQEGSTDSERILLYIVHMVNCRQAVLQGPMGVLERLALLQAVIRDMAKGNKLNLILWDGELMYVHTNYKDSLYYSRREAGTVFSTTPLDRGEWTSVPFTALCAWKNGKLYFEGEPHGHEYIDNAEDMKYIYASFAEL